MCQSKSSILRDKTNCLYTVCMSNSGFPTSHLKLSFSHELYMEYSFLPLSQQKMNRIPHRVSRIRNHSCTAVQKGRLLACQLYLICLIQKHIYGSKDVGRRLKLLLFQKTSHINNIPRVITPITYKRCMYMYVHCLLIHHKAFCLNFVGSKVTRRDI